jgi:hypothetical protein
MGRDRGGTHCCAGVSSETHAGWVTSKVPPSMCMYFGEYR